MLCQVVRSSARYLYLQLSNNDVCVCEGGKIPADRNRTLTRSQHIHPTVVIAVMTLCDVGATLAVAFLAFNIWFRKIRSVYCLGKGIPTKSNIYSYFAVYGGACSNLIYAQVHQTVESQVKQRGPGGLSTRVLGCGLTRH